MQRAPEDEGEGDGTKPSGSVRALSGVAYLFGFLLAAVLLSGFLWLVSRVWGFVVG